MTNSKLQLDRKEYCTLLENNAIILKLLQNKRFLITGVTGQVGSYFAKLLLDLSNRNELGLSIVGVSRDRAKFVKEFSTYINYSNLNFVQWDVSEKNRNISQFKNIDYVIHAASNANPRLYKDNPVETMTGNFLGTFNIFELFRELNQKPEFIFLSTGEIYGYNSNRDIISESDYGYINFLESRSCYPISKIASETLVASFSEEYNFDCKIARLSHVFGPISNSNRVIDYILMCGATNKNITLQTAGKQIRTYTYIGDVVTALLYILLFGESKKAYNVCSDDSKSIYDIARMVSQYSSVALETLNFPNSDSREQIVLDNTSLKSIGWEPSMDLYEGIRRSIDAMGEFLWYE